ncbi:OLC1v1003304C1 [Oldenlandia corymbosa var. corymbosa]|uniref:OLC1v1003304C1 n=1 Tax=Oldenlandia corymbosa var. corymbosa TaxID=529605 RepID=A0AAV1DAJ1_OLDCO|nr:OLC1v1003304C1 [Oldenlandia corymbosa var. corymbosa]
MERPISVAALLHDEWFRLPTPESNHSATMLALFTSLAKGISEKMRVVFVLLACTLLLITGFLCSSVSSTNDAYPTGYGDESGSCMSHREGLKPLRREIYYGGGEIIDITHKLTPNTPGGTIEGCGEYLSLVKSMKNGSDSNASEMKLHVHVGTHVDAPGHIYDHYYDAGFDVDSLDLRVLNGLALVVDIPRDKNITGVLNSIKIHD